MANVALISLQRYLLWADTMKRHHDERNYPDDQAKAHWEPYLATWLGGLYVVVEGWSEQGFVDAEIDDLLNDRGRVDLLRRYRNGAFHYQASYFDERFVALWRDDDAIPNEAKRFLKRQEGKVANGEAVTPRSDRIRYEDIRRDLLEHYATMGRRDATELGWRLKHLDRFFGGRRVADITEAPVTSYVARRQEQGAANGTINRELATLGPMMRLAYRRRKAPRLLLVERLKESAPRAGFFEEEQYRAVLRHLPADLQVVAAIAYRFGWRARSEILPLERRHLDLEQGTLALDPGMTKNGDGRKVYLTPDLKAALEAQLGRVDALQRKLGRISRTCSRTAAASAPARLVRRSTRLGGPPAARPACRRC
jgi:hypothetical protein